MLIVAFDFGRTSEMTLHQHRAGVTAERDRAGVIHGPAGDYIFGLAHVGDYGLERELHTSGHAGEAERLARKVASGKGFDMTDLKGQLEQLQKMGGMGALLDKLPGAAAQKSAVSADAGDQQVRRQIAIINSMTPRERRQPAVIDGSRRRRIGR